MACVLCANMERFLLHVAGDASPILISSAVQLLESNEYTVGCCVVSV